MRILSRLKGRSTAELRDRLVQYARAMAERRGFHPSIVIPPAMELRPATPWGTPDAASISRRLSSQEADALIVRANRILTGTFDVLGLQGLSFGSPVNWQLDPHSGHVSPMTHWSRVPYLDFDKVGDHKIVWELNRHQWLLMLGQASILTGDRRYAVTAAALLQEWLTANPPKRGINWCSSLELAFRVQSWIHALRLFDSAPEFSKGLRADLVASVALQVEHIERNLSSWFSPNTHLTGEALAMLSVGCAWPMLPQAKRWRERGWQILCAESKKQIRPDGVYFEQSAWYQSYTVDFYVLALQWADQAKLTRPVGLTERVRSAAHALRAVTRPDGTIARFGDDDGGCLLPLTTTQFGDMTGSLWRAAWHLNDAALIPPTLAGRSALLWLEGGSAFDTMVQRAAGEVGRATAALRDGGWITLVERADSAQLDHWLVLDAGPHGALTHAHSHADALGFDLSVHGRPFLVDAGTAAYVGARRHRYRRTAVHNTVTVDGADSSEQGSSFNWRTTAASQLESFGAVARASFVTASHDGYMRLADPVRHQRTILRFDRQYWLMFDTLTAASTHTVSLTFQASPEVRATLRAPNSCALTRDGVTLHLTLDPILTGALEMRSVSPAYALELPAVAFVATTQIAGPTVFCTAFGAEDECGELAVRRNAEASCWRIDHANGTDLIARPAGATVTLGPARFDGAVLALLGGENPHSIVAAGQGILHLDGHALTVDADDIRVATRASDGTWTMES
jgi:Heparinase II/III-like protein/Heparinase II/III N-terminus